MAADTGRLLARALDLRAEATADNPLPTIDPKTDTMEDVWAWCEAAARRGITAQRCDAILAAVRAHAHREDSR